MLDSNANQHASTSILQICDLIDSGQKGVFEWLTSAVHPTNPEKAPEHVHKCLCSNFLSSLNKIPDLKQAALNDGSQLTASAEAWHDSDISNLELTAPGVSATRHNSYRGRAGGALLCYGNSHSPP